MANNLQQGASITNPTMAVANPAIFSALGGFGGGRGHHTQMQYGADPSQINEINLGQQGYTPAYDSNQKGSFEGNYNTILNQFTPDQLLKRYQNGKAEQYQTNLDKTNAQAYNSFKSLIGRDPTANELAQVIPAFQAGPQLGNAWLSQFAEIEKQKPANLQKRAGDFKDQVNQVFKSQLGRDATADEITHFGSLFASGNLDAYQMQDFLKGTPEYQNNQDKQFRTDLSGELQKSDQNFFDRAKQSVMAQFMQNGTGNSTALDSALVDLMGQIQSKRSDYLANLSSQQYGSNKNLAISNYGNTMDQYLKDKNYNRGLSQNTMDQYMNRSNELVDYNRQMQDYMNYANSYNPRNNGFAGMGAGALSGAGAFAATGNPYAIGAGGLAGGLFGYLGSRG